MGLHPLEVAKVVVLWGLVISVFQQEFPSICWLDGEGPQSLIRKPRGPNRCFAIPSRASVLFSSVERQQDVHAELEVQDVIHVCNEHRTHTEAGSKTKTSFDALKNFLH